jgi:hypothetical protein
MPFDARILTTLALLCGLAATQSTTRPMYLDRARIQRTGTQVTVTANDSMPLFQAIYALSLEYGWQVNREAAPCYSRFDTVDDTAPKWRAAHPGEKGVTRPAGGLFVATLPDPGKASAASSEQDVLARLINQYNATDNPGKYAVRIDGDETITVVGTQVRDEAGVLQEIAPLLDTPVTLPRKQRNVYDTIELVLSALQSATGKKTLFAVASSSLFINTQLTLGGGEKIPARELLKQALARTGRALQYELSFNPDVPVYLLSVSPVMREEDNGVGGRSLVPMIQSQKP